MGDCGIFIGHTLHDTYKGLKYLQHRGEDTAGIAALSSRGIDVLRWQGMVEDFSLETVGTLLEGGFFIGEVRYSTMKGKSRKELFKGALPRFKGGRVTALYEDSPYLHMIVRGAAQAMVHNGTLVGVNPVEGCTDTDVMLEFYSREGSIEKIIKQFPAAYSAAVLDTKKDEVSIFKDRYGIRPLWIGEKDGKLVAASEDVAIWGVGGKPIREVRAGEIICIPRAGTNFISKQVTDPTERPCFFEKNYLGSESSSFGGYTNQSTRIRMGLILSSEYHPDVDFVTYIPRAPGFLARGFSEGLNVPLIKVFYKAVQRRAFLGATPEKRKESIGENLFVVDNVDLEGKRIAVCDDSVVRLNNAPDAAEKLRRRGVSWMTLVLGTPMIGGVVEGEKRGCLYGVDMPPDDDFAVRKYKNLEEITKASGFDEVYFISYEGMSKAHGIALENCCAYCIGGKNPVTENDLKTLEGFRIKGFTK